MRQSTLLISNTGITLTRMMITVGMGLLATRLFLDVLGKVDFGLISTLAASGALLGLLSLAMTTSVQRHLAYDIGKQDFTQLSATFSSSLMIFFAIGLVILVLGISLTPLVINGLTIPETRRDAALWVYVATILSLAMTTILTPYKAIIAARQEFLVISMVDILSSGFRLGIAASLFHISGDALKGYAWLNLLAVAIPLFVLVCLCVIREPASRPRISKISWPAARAIAGFAGWSLLSQMAWSIRQQGAVILINVTFGPAINAAYAVTIQLSSYAGNLGQALYRAVQPAIVSLHAKQANEQVARLALVTSKYMFCLISVVFVGVLIKTDTLLDLWLTEPPEYSSMLTRIVVIWVTLQTLSTGHGLAIHASGNIGWFSRMIFMLATGSLILALILVLGFRCGPWAIPVSTLVLVLVQVNCVVFFVGRKLGISYQRWLTETLAPVLLVVCTGGLAAIVAAAMLPSGLISLIGVWIAYAAVALPILWLFGTANWERIHFLRLANTIVSRLKFSP